jgi:hypothetical protein
MAPSREFSDLLRADVTCSPVEKAANEFAQALENAFLEPIKATQEIWQNCIPEKLRAQSADAGP